MRAEFDEITIKIWFSNMSISRNIADVVEIKIDNNLIMIKDVKGKTFLINFNNVNSIEEVNNN